MGQDNSKRKSTYSETEYFKEKNKEQIQHFTKVNGFLENSSEWIVLFREEFSRFEQLKWSRPVLKIIAHWESYQDTSTKMAFAWNKYTSARIVSKVDQTNACLWQQSIANLQTFTYEVEVDPYKKALNSFLCEKPNCSLYQIIRTFKKSIVAHYCDKISNQFILKPKVLKNIGSYLKDIDKMLIDFILIISKVIPKYFLDMPKNIQDMDSIVRNAIISSEVLSLVLLLRKQSSSEHQSQYLRSLESFHELTIESEILEKFEKDKNENYGKALQSILEIGNSKSIGQMHDTVALLMNYISMGLFDEKNPNQILDDGEIIKAFLLVIGKSSYTDLPHYVDILNTFLDNHTLDVKGVGKGITKLTYIINNSKDWGSFISY